MRQAAARMRTAPRALILAVLALAACGPAIDTTFDDAAITARVRRALLNDPIVRGLPVNVETRAGLVTLTGDVRSEAQASQAVAVARTVAGVAEIESRLRVVEPAARSGSPVWQRDPAAAKPRSPMPRHEEGEYREYSTHRGQRPAPPMARWIDGRMPRDFHHGLPIVRRAVGLTHAL